MDIKLNLNDLVTLPDKSIYALVNDTDKKVYIGFSSNTLSSLFRILNDTRSSNSSLRQDLDKLSFKVLEEIDSSNKLRVRYQFWVNEYSNLGYSLYRKYKAIDYKVRIEVMNDFRDGCRSSYLFYVKLVSRSRSELLVGIFDSVTAAESFVNNNYANIHNIIYSGNELTRAYYAR